MDAIGDEDQEWEYEYDENETEDFYVVLELPPASALKPKSKADELFAAHDPTDPKNKPSRTGKKGKKRKKAAADDEENNEDEAPATPAEPNEDAEFGQQPALPNIESLNLAAAIEKASDTTPKGLQIMDLESDEPMIMYQGQIYSCQWASSLGSDLLFMRRPEKPGPDYKPLHSFREIDILAISAAKLVASPATIEHRQDFTRQSDLDAPLEDTDLNIQNEDVIRQARFLGRIAEIKARRGEQVGNLQALAESVHKHPENFGPDGKPLRGRGRGGRRAVPGPHRQTPTDTATSTPTITTIQARRASTPSNTGLTPTPAAWADLEQDEDQEMEGG